MCKMNSLCALILCCTIVGMLVCDSTADTSCDVQGGFAFEMIMTTLKLLEDQIIPKEEQMVKKSCSEVPSSGVYTIQPEKPFKPPMMVLCDQQYESGGWVVIQHRFEGSTNFYRNWQEYKNGFGNLEGEFWLGLDRIHQLTASTPYELAVVMEDFDGNKTFAKYDQFEIGDEIQKYMITKLGLYSGTASDSFRSTLGMKFSTFDADNDMGEGNCAVTLTGAWWYNICQSSVFGRETTRFRAFRQQSRNIEEMKLHQSNLNGKYLRGITKEDGTGMGWNTFRGQHYALKSSKMMIRPKHV